MQGSAGYAQRFKLGAGLYFSYAFQFGFLLSFNAIMITDCFCCALSSSSSSVSPTAFGGTTITKRAKHKKKIMQTRLNNEDTNVNKRNKLIAATKDETT